MKHALLRPSLLVLFTLLALLPGISSGALHPPSLAPAMSATITAGLDPAALVKDINATAATTRFSSIESVIAIGTTLYFTAATSESGQELWKSDGTAAGTALVKDINPGTDGSDPKALTAVGSTLYFSASDGTSGTELWKSDGTAAGTIRVKNINPNGNSSPLGFTLLGSLVYFSASDGTTGTELWRTDGTTAGTTLVKDIRGGTCAASIDTPGPCSSDPAPLTVIGSTLYFSADDGAKGQELWRSDGTTAGTALVKDIYPGSDGSFPGELTALGTTLYFAAKDGANGQELWKSDGTAAGTTLVKDIHGGECLDEFGTSGPCSSRPESLTTVGTTLYFSASNGTTGTELWKSDGTAAGTTLIKDIKVGTCVRNDTPAPCSSSPRYLTAVGSTLYFAADDGATGTELWKSDGTTAGTALVKDIKVGTCTEDDTPAPCSSDLSSLTAVGSTLYFSADDGANGQELWKSDGTTAGTTLVKDINPNGSSSPHALTAVGTTLYFTTIFDITSGSELWKSDSTAAGTTRVDVLTRTGSSSPSNLTNMNGVLFFISNDGTSGRELWKSDGTAAGTAVVKDINPGAESSMDDRARLVRVGATLYFTATDGTSGRELWKSDGTTAGTTLVKVINTVSGSNPENLTAVGATLYFTVDDGTSGYELWKSDGTAAGTTLVKDIRGGTCTEFDTQGPCSSRPESLTTVGTTLYFTADDGASGRELWKSDGTAAGTTLVKDIRGGTCTKDGKQAPCSSGSTSLTAVGSRLYFISNDGTSGEELWKSDGTTASTTLVKDIRGGTCTENGQPAPCSSGSTSLTAVGSRLYFAANDGTSGYELWKSDGTAAGTTLVKNINAGARDSYPSSLTALGATLYFAANDGTSGYELWKSDGTTAGTTLVKDIVPGALGYRINLEAVGGLLLFGGFDAQRGVELWRSDGTAGGTVVVQDLAGGTANSNPDNFTAVGTQVFFSAFTESTGTELWSALTLNVPRSQRVYLPVIRR